MTSPSRGSPSRDGGAAVGELAHDALRDVRILLVEDDEDGRELLELVLSDYGAHVRAVPDVAQALVAFDAEGIDVLVSDIGLPKEDGYALVRRVRARPANRGGRTPAVALTAYTSHEDRARALAAGFNVHVAKPVEPQSLARVVASLARGACLD